MLRDKDIAGVIGEVAPSIDCWHLASLSGPRGSTSAELAEILRARGVREPCVEHASPVEAFIAAREAAHLDDKIIVFGSFVTVGEVMAHLEAARGGAPTRG